MLTRTNGAVSDTVFECSFEGKHMCGMTAGQGDTEWAIGYVFTPSLDTGPTSAQSGSFFMFTEASGMKPHALAR